MAWNPLLFRFHPFIIVGGILLLGRSQDLDLELHLLNCYGPYVGRQQFWSSLEAVGLLDLNSLVIVGDLNLTLQSGEIWGLSTRPDPLQYWFRSLFARHGLVDVAPKPISFTWWNGRKDVAHIAKRLDRFLLCERLLGTVTRCTSSIVPACISDHLPILLKVGIGERLYRFPFKFYNARSASHSFEVLVREHWSLSPSPRNVPIMIFLPSFLCSLKKVVTPWVHSYLQTQKEKLLVLEEHILSYYQDPNFHNLVNPDVRIL